MTSGRVAGKTAVIIGGASGIGWAAAQHLHADGAAVVIADVNEQQAATRLHTLAGSRSHRVDVTDETSVSALFSTVRDEFGGHDIVVNCAGINKPGRIVDLDAADWRATVDLCLTGAFYVIKHAARAMNHGGSIISIASLNARQPADGFAGYCAAKAGLVMLTEVAALELAAHGIRVNAISPGLVETPLVDALTSVPVIQNDFTDNTPLARNGRPADIADAVLYLASDESSWVTGEVLNINGGAHLRRYPDVMKHLAALTHETG